jgi:hypothetical protein
MLSSFYLAIQDVDNKLLKAMKRFPPGKDGNWRGADADWKKGQEALVVVAKTAKPVNKRNARNMQIVVGFDGRFAVPAQPGLSQTIFTGLARFSMSGGFGEGGWLSGDTSLEGFEIGDEIDLFNTKSRGAGWLDPDSGSFVHISRIPSDADTVTVSLRAVADGALSYDVMTLPSGGRHIGLPERPWGFNIGANIDPDSVQVPYFCQSVSTFPAQDLASQNGSAASDPYLIETTFGFSDPVEALVIDSFQLSLYPVDSDDDPTIVEGKVEILHGLNAARASARAPAGLWMTDMFVVVPELFLPGREIEERPLFNAQFGNGGLLVGSDFEGFVTGDEDCGRWQVPGTACDYIDYEALAKEMGLEGEFEEVDETAADGTLLCIGVEVETSQPDFIVGIGRDYFTIEDLARDAAEHPCPSSEVSLGAGGFLFDCSDEGFESHAWVIEIEDLFEFGPFERARLSSGLLAFLDIKTTGLDSNGGFIRPQTRRAIDALTESVAAAVRRHRAAVDQ